MSRLVSDTQLCRQCGGRCCQGHPGVWVDPQRFLRLFCEGERLDPERLPAGTHLRRLGDIPVPAPRTTERGCIFLGEHGCRLAATARPCQCLALCPSLDTLLDDEIHCTLPPGYGAQSARENWQRYWNRTFERKA